MRCESCESDVAEAEAKAVPRGDLNAAIAKGYGPWGDAPPSTEWPRLMRRIWWEDIGRRGDAVFCARCENALRTFDGKDDGAVDWREVFLPFIAAAMLKAGGRVADIDLPSPYDVAALPAAAFRRLAKSGDIADLPHALNLLAEVFRQRPYPIGELDAAVSALAVRLLLDAIARLGGAELARPVLHQIIANSFLGLDLKNAAWQLRTIGHPDDADLIALIDFAGDANDEAARAHRLAQAPTAAGWWAMEHYVATTFGKASRRILEELEKLPRPAAAILRRYERTYGRFIGGTRKLNMPSPLAEGRAKSGCLFGTFAVFAGWSYAM